MKYHLCTPTRKAIELFRAGNSVFYGQPVKLWNALIRQQQLGREYFSGCDNEDANGRCAGHPFDA